MKKIVRRKPRRKNPPPFTKANAWKWIDANIEQFRVHGKIDRIQLEQALYNYFGREQVSAYIRKMDWDWFNSLITEAIGEYEYKRQLKRVNPRQTTQHKRLKNHRKQNPDVDNEDLARRIWGDESMHRKKVEKLVKTFSDFNEIMQPQKSTELPTQFKHYGEPVGKKDSLDVNPPYIDISLLGIQPIKKMPENKIKVFELGRLLGIKKGLECKNIKTIELIYSTKIPPDLDYFFDYVFPHSTRSEAFALGVIFGLKIGIKLCGLTKFMQRRDELRRTNRELLYFSEYM